MERFFLIINESSQKTVFLPGGSSNNRIDVVMCFETVILLDIDCDIDKK